MKRLYFPLFALTLFVAAVYTMAFRKAEAPVERVQNRYLQNLQQTNRLSLVLDQKAKAFQAGEATLDELRAAYTDCRNAYKRIEFMTAYIDHDFVNRNVNGAPLLHLEKNAPSLSVLKPVGLQVLEEEIFGETVSDENKEQIADLTGKLTFAFEDLVRFHRVQKLTDRMVFESVRQHMVRMLTLGLTGFDSPVNASSLPEAKLGMEECYEAMKPYQPALAEKEGQIYPSLQEKFEGAIKYLEANQDFDTFDRLHFLKEYVNPVFKLVKDAHLALYIETYYETSPLWQKHSINYYADNIFDADFLNPFYHAYMSDKMYQPKVVDLGRKLFFDPVLSNNIKRACASCHQPDKAFTDGRPKSLATDMDSTVNRNSPTLVNAAYSDRFFYDLRTQTLEDQIDHVVASSEEFRTSFVKIFEKLRKSEEYVQLFKEAFPDDTRENVIYHRTLSTALAAYVISLKGLDSEFDRYVRGEIDQIDEPVKRGFNLFMGKAGCGTCHFAPTFNGSVPPLYHESESEVLGVPADPDGKTLDKDPGRAMGVLKERVYFYHRSFKTTTVRNAALTAPYMHNGVYETLEQVVDFYNKGGGEGMGLDVPYQTLPPDPLGLSEQEQKDLVAFMEALTDTTGLTRKPESLPAFPEKLGYNDRTIGGDY